VTFEFRDAVRADVELLILLAGGTGSGKTESAMRLATGLSGGRPFAVIDTENGRALHKADDYDFKHATLGEPFTPERYAEAVKAADDAGFPVIVIDSGSHEYEGVGGVLDSQTVEFERMGGKESAKMSSWIKPKQRHKRFVQQLLRTRAHVILCLRAEDKIEIVKDASGKTLVRPKESLTGAQGWIPICEKRLPFEATISLLLTADAPGVPKAIKLERRHETLIPLDRPLDESVGSALRAWAAGAAEGAAGEPGDGEPPAAHAPSATTDERPTQPMIKKLNVLVGTLREAGHITTEQLYRAMDPEGEAEWPRDEQGELHWSPLRDSLTKQEAHELIDRLSRLEARVAV
jgi:hypothetical protein